MEKLSKNVETQSIGVLKLRNENIRREKKDMIRKSEIIVRRP